ncbi:MAG TPA: PTS sugar transporter subunit IIA [Gemmataceae bacterium]|jgi:PTS system fructose-specific IIA component/PTS system nitrogen regulatory IIA component|nr:PTS sugar transporter subunit IIA [Gemmataceae bacterium]
MADVPDPLGRIATELGFPMEPIPKEAAVSRDLAVRYLVGKLADHRLLPAHAVDVVTNQVLKRESIGSTGFGKGFAIPHTKHDGVQGHVGICGWSEIGIPWEAIDGENVHSVCLMVAAPNPPGAYLRALGTISGMFRS